MFKEVSEIILFFICLSSGCLGMSARIIQQETFSNGISFIKKMIISIFLSVVIFLFIGMTAPSFNISNENLAIFKIMSCLLAAGYFYDKTLGKLEFLYKEKVMARIDIATQAVEQTKGEKNDDK